MKKLKLPNGFGSISYYGEHRRRPYVAKKYIDGRQKPIGYYATYEDALAYLIAYNKNPSLFNPSEITFSEIFKLWSAEHFPKIAKTTSANYTAAYKHCEPLYGKKFITLKISDLQDVIRAMSRAKIGYASQKKCRQLLHNLYNYAVKYEIISASADISKYIDIDKKRIVYPKSPFNTRQLNRVKRLAESDEPLSCWAKVVVMMVYSGVRPSEMLAVRKCDVKLKQRYLIVRDSKTEAGRNRAVPISRKALPYFRAWMDKPGKTLITVDDGAALSYHRFRTRFATIAITIRKSLAVTLTSALSAVVQSMDASAPCTSKAIMAALIRSLALSS